MHIMVKILKLVKKTSLENIKASRIKKIPFLLAICSASSLYSSDIKADQIANSSIDLRKPSLVTNSEEGKLFELGI